MQTSAAKETIAKNLLQAIEKYLLSKPVIKNSTDTLPRLTPSDLAALNTNGNIVDTFDYYKMYGKAATYKGQKIKSVFIRNTDNKAIVVLANGNKLIMTQAQAFKANIIAPPPPPPPPPQFDPAAQTKDSPKESTVSTSVKGVLYIGINNPIMAYATGIKEKDLVLEISNGSLTGSNGNNYIARVSKPGKTIITLRKIGDSKIINSFEFIAKRLPDITDPAFPEELKRKTELQRISGDAADTENALYVINGKIIGKGKTANADIDKIIAEKVYVKWLKKSEAVAKYGKQGADGACEVTYTNGEIIKFSENIKPTNDLDNNESNNRTGIRPGVKFADPSVKLFIGSYGGGRISLDELKTQKELNVSQGYSFISATVYFSYPEKNIVKMLTLNSLSGSAMNEAINSCTPGCTLIFDKVYIKDNNGEVKMVLNPPGFTVIDKNFTETQKNDQQNKDENIVFTKAEINPEFTGGQDAWRKYLIANLKAITPVDEGWKAGIYKVVVKFIVHTDGTVSDVTTENYAGTKTALHCIEVIKNAPKWQPALQNGRKVNAYKKQPITFVIEE
ncbi:MAG: energy transducer TonB [Chitinophagaceae bacterium]|nr:energy transducer TonB [Chitinophagaceae bacterium]